MYGWCIRLARGRWPGVGSTWHSLHTTSVTSKNERRVKQKEAQGDDGSHSLEITPSHAKHDLFIAPDSHERLFGGVPYSELPVCHVRASKNNTIMSVWSWDDKPMLYRSCGMDGFRNARKRTTVAANTTGTVLALRAVEKGLSNVRVCVRGLGAGRIEALKGLVSGGLNIVSITDTTKVVWGFYRGKKVRRL